MNGLGSSLRQAMQILRDATCSRCGKRIAVMATSWKGHGTGQRGASHYSATSFEQHDDTTHCRCTREELEAHRIEQNHERMLSEINAPRLTPRQIAERQRAHFERTGELIVGDEPWVRD